MIYQRKYVYSDQQFRRCFTDSDSAIHRCKFVFVKPTTERHVTLLVLQGLRVGDKLAARQWRSQGGQSGQLPTVELDSNKIIVESVVYAAELN